MLRFLCSPVDEWPDHDTALSVLDVVDKDGLKALTDEQRVIWQTMTGAMSATKGKQADYGLITDGFLNGLEEALKTAEFFAETWTKLGNPRRRKGFGTYRAAVVTIVSKEIINKVQSSATVEQRTILGQMASKIRRILCRDPATEFCPEPIFCSLMVEIVVRQLGKTPNVIKEVRDTIVTLPAWHGIHIPCWHGIVHIPCWHGRVHIPC
jgi:hypothetical protein